MRFFLPSVPIFSQNDSSFSSFLTEETGGFGDFGLGDAIVVFPSPGGREMRYLTVCQSIKLVPALSSSFWWSEQ